MSEDASILICWLLNAGYAPLSGSALIDAGVTPAGWEGLGDLAGNPRVYGRTVDLGCYELLAPKGFSLFVR